MLHTHTLSTGIPILGKEICADNVNYHVLEIYSTTRFKFYLLVSPLTSARSSARLALLAATLLASLTHHPCRQASSAHHSRCSLIQHFWHTLLTLLGKNHTRRQVPTLFMTYPTIHQSFSQISPQTAEKKHLLHSSSAPWWPIRTPPGPGGKGTHDLPNHPPNF